MGEEQKEEEEIVLKVDMHCEGCAKKVQKSLRKFEGVEEVKTDSMLNTVVVKGKGADPVKLCERVQKKTGRRAEIISPLPAPPPPEEETKEEAPPPENKEEPPKPTTVVLKIRMHCEACAQALQKRIKKVEGVESVVTDVPNEQVIVQGFVEPAKLVESVYKKTRRQASIVVPVEEEKKEEEKTEEEKHSEEKKGEEGDEKSDDTKKMEYWPPKDYLEFVNSAYVYPPPEVFSDENPNACSIM